MQRIENMPRSPPLSHRPEELDNPDRSPTGWHHRNTAQNTLMCFMGVVNNPNETRRVSVSIGGEYVAMPPTCAIEYQGVGEVWKVHPNELEVY